MSPEDVSENLAAELPLPVLPLPYEGVASNPFVSVFRAMGGLAIALATLHLGTDFLVMLSISTALSRIPTSQKGAWAAFYILETALSLLLNLVLMTAGFGSIKGKAFAAPLMVVWAWATLGAIVFQFIVSTLLMHKYYYSLSGAAAKVEIYTVLESAARTVSWASAPIVYMLLLRNRSFREGLRHR